MKKLTRINRVIIHCAGTPPSLDVGMAWVRDIHVNENGWSSEGYHYLFRRGGKLELGRQDLAKGIFFQGAHTGGQNHDSLGICLVGGVAEEKDENGKWVPQNNFTDAQWKGLKDLITVLRDKYPGITVHGHNEFAKRACPSFDVQQWMLDEFSECSPVILPPKPVKVEKRKDVAWDKEPIPLKKSFWQRLKGRFS